MQDTPTATPSSESARRTAVRRRAKRGLLAGYIHELSGRHNRRAPRRQHEVRTDSPIEQPQGG